MRRIASGNEHLLEITTSDRTVEVLPGITKGDALRQLAGDYGIPLEDILVIGDSGTDAFAMGIGEVIAACPANATDEIVDIVKAKDVERGYIAKNERLEGWLEIIEHFFPLSR